MGARCLRDERLLASKIDPNSTGPTLGPTQTNSNIIAIADAFLELYEKRQEADYDHEAVFTRADVRGHIALARQAVALVEQVNSGAAETFFGLVALKAKPMT